MCSVIPDALSWSCTLCGYSSAKAENCRRHLKAKHPDRLVRECICLRGCRGCVPDELLCHGPSQSRKSQTGEREASPPDTPSPAKCRRVSKAAVDDGAAVQQDLSASSDVVIDSLQSPSLIEQRCHLKAIFPLGRQRGYTKSVRGALYSAKRAAPNDNQAAIDALLAWTPTMWENRMRELKVSVWQILWPGIEPPPVDVLRNFGWANISFPADPETCGRDPKVHTEPIGGDHISWIRRCSELETWVEEHNNRLPSKYGKDANEAFLGNFLSNACYSHKAGTLSDVRSQRLWGIPPVRKRLNVVTWEERCSELREWASQHGQLPKQHAKDSLELSLAKWLNRTHRLFRHKMLSAAQLSQLRQVLGGERRVERWENWLMPVRWTDELDKNNRFISSSSRRQIDLSSSARRPSPSIDAAPLTSLDRDSTSSSLSSSSASSSTEAEVRPREDVATTTADPVLRLPEITTVAVGTIDTPERETSSSISSSSSSSSTSSASSDEAGDQLTDTTLTQASAPIQRGDAALSIAPAADGGEDLLRLPETPASGDAEVAAETLAKDVAYVPVVSSHATSALSPATETGLRRPRRVTFAAVIEVVVHIVSFKEDPFCRYRPIRGIECNDCGQRVRLKYGCFRPEKKRSKFARWWFICNSCGSTDCDD